MFEILGYIFAAIIVCYVVTSIAMACVNLFKDIDDCWTSIKTAVSYYWYTKDKMYLLPCIGIEKTNWLNIYLNWIYLEIVISIYINTAAEDDREYMARRND